MKPFCNQLAATWQRFIHSLAEARRVRRDLRELARMSEAELRDLGISPMALAVIAQGASPRA